MGLIDMTVLVRVVLCGSLYTSTDPVNSGAAKRVTTLGASKSDIASMIWRIAEASTSQTQTPLTGVPPQVCGL
jgi:hypothetical protein